MKNFTKRVTALVLAVSMMFASASIVHANVAEDMMLLPLRTIFEDAGASVDWVDGVAVIVMPNGDEWVFTPGAYAATLNSYDVPLSTPITVTNGVARISIVDLALFYTEGKVDFNISFPYQSQAADTEPLGELAVTTATAMATAPAFMEAVGVTGLTMAIVDTQTGFTWTHGFGYADSVGGLPVDEHTLFQVGSTSKPFTAIAIMQLVEQGLIDLDTPLVHYIPEFSMLPSPVLGGDSDDVTVRMLLTNTAGIPGNKLYGWLITGEEQYHGHMNNLLEWLPTRDLVFPPGMAFDYSNNGWTLLSILVARVMGYDNYFEGFTAHANETIFAPLGMERSTFEFTPGLTNVSMAYTTLGVQDVMHTVSPIGAGGLLSSAHDMAIFMHAIGSGEALLSQEALGYMKQTHSVMAPGVIDYGLGFLRMFVGDLELVGHGGNITHFHTEMLIDQETGLGVFVSTNTISGILIASALAITVMETAITEKTGIAPALLPPPGQDATDGALALSEEELIALAAFEGLYHFGESGIWEMTIIDGTLTWSNGGITFELTPLPDGTFDSIAGNYSFELVDGEPTVTHTNGGEQFTTTRIDAGDDDAFAPPEGFSDWVGVYVFKPQVTNEAALVLQLIVGVNALGNPVITIIQPIHTYIGLSEAPLVEYNGNWIVGTMPVIFIVDEDGNRSIDILGGLFVMVD
ncbi:MAG: serine hydrolase [Defluviitaleaceae bacterium]|nr:serine hydrolase [Defluviitaleaceae bacterium]